MKHILLLLLIVYPSAGTKESLDEFSSLFDDPELLFELRKRLGKLLDDNVEADDYSEPEVGCYALSGTLNGDCNFHTNGSTIIKTTESIGNNATFVSNIANVSCARDCTAACCLNEECDTALYQDKKEHNCYLFKCGQPSRCIFVHHSDYWMSSSSKAVHTSHKYTPGGATHSHENELTSLGMHVPDNVVLKTTAKAIVQTTQTPRTQKPTTDPVAKVTYKPNLDEDCQSYATECADPHAECLMKKCRCRVGYHVKHNICRKHCQDYEFECDMTAYGGDAECVHDSLVCNGKQDCEDGSDEYSCPSEKEEKPDVRPSQQGPLDKDDQKGVRPTIGSVVTEGPNRVVSQGLVKDAANGSPSITQAPVSVEDPAIKGGKSEEDQSSSESTDDNPTNSHIDSTETDSESSKESSNNDNTTNIDQDGDNEYFRVLNADEVQVATYTDSSQGPIVALALGLSITMMLLIFVGCRLRTVKRRLRKGRALHSNEADYLINGMYL